MKHTPWTRGAARRLAVGYLVLLLGIALLSWFVPGAWMPSRALSATEAATSHPFWWMAWSTRRTLFALSIALGLSLSGGTLLGIALATRVPVSAPLGHAVQILNSVPAFVIVGLWRAQHGSFQGYDVACIIGVLNGIETAHWVTRKVQDHFAWRGAELHGATRESRQQAVRRYVTRALAGNLATSAARTTGAVIGLDALLALFDLSSDSLMSWGTLLGERVGHGGGLNYAELFAFSGAVFLPLSMVLVATRQPQEAPHFARPSVGQTTSAR